MQEEEEEKQPAPKKLMFEVIEIYQQDFKAFLKYIPKNHIEIIMPINKRKRAYNYGRDYTHNKVSKRIT